MTFPVLSTIQNEDGRLARNYRKILRLSAFLIFPMMLMLSAIADPLVRYLEQMKDLLPIFGVSLVMWLVIHASLWLTSNLYIQLPLGIVVGAIVYVVGAKWLLRSEWEDAMGMIPVRLKRK